jgi:hypothetical protein
MNGEIIVKVEVLNTGELLLGLEGQGKPIYQNVYREAAGVYWDKKRNGFKSTSMKEWSCSKWYKHIVEAVRNELGVQLTLGPNVTWLNIPDHEKAEILRERPGGTR